MSRSHEAITASDRWVPSAASMPLFVVTEMAGRQTAEAERHTPSSCGSAQGRQVTTLISSSHFIPWDWFSVEGVLFQQHLRVDYFTALSGLLPSTPFKPFPRRIKWSEQQLHKDIWIDCMPLFAQTQALFPSQCYKLHLKHFRDTEIAINVFCAASFNSQLWGYIANLLPPDGTLSHFRVESVISLTKMEAPVRWDSSGKTFSKPGKYLVRQHTTAPNVQNIILIIMPNLKPLIDTLNLITQLWPKATIKFSLTCTKKDKLLGNNVLKSQHPTKFNRQVSIRRECPCYVYYFKKKVEKLIKRQLKKASLKLWNIQPFETLKNWREDRLDDAETHHSHQQNAWECQASPQISQVTSWKYSWKTDERQQRISNCYPVHKKWPAALSNLYLAFFQPGVFNTPNECSFDIHV